MNSIKIKPKMLSKEAKRFYLLGLEFLRLADEYQNLCVIIDEVIKDLPKVQKYCNINDRTIFPLLDEIMDRPSQKDLDEVEKFKNDPALWKNLTTIDDGSNDGEISDHYKRLTKALNAKNARPDDLTNSMAAMYKAYKTIAIPLFIKRSKSSFLRSVQEEALQLFGDHKKLRVIEESRLGDVQYLVQKFHLPKVIIVEMTSTKAEISGAMKKDVFPDLFDLRKKELPLNPDFSISGWHAPGFNVLKVKDEKFQEFNLQLANKICQIKMFREGARPIDIAEAIYKKQAKNESEKERASTTEHEKRKEAGQNLKNIVRGYFPGKVEKSVKKN